MMSHLQSQHPQKSRAIAIWLFVIVVMVAMQCTIGAVTRLTESGLSIVTWAPIKGALPPLTQEDWLAEFAAYQTSPQYLKVNRGMSLPEFQNIFWWEWVHRFWARLIGVAFALPLLLFWIKGWIPTGYKPRLLALLALGGAQGVMGWFMVASGLVDNPAVSHLRLAAHLLLALLIATLALRWGLALWRADTRTEPLPRSLRAHGYATLVMVIITITYGAFVAGLDAGMIYNEFPLMGDALVPSEFWSMSPWWLNLLDNHAAVQFIHRWLGVISAIMLLAFGLRGLKTSPAHWGFRICVLMSFLQPALGIATLLMHVPIALGAAHQLGAVIVLLALSGSL